MENFFAPRKFIGIEISKNFEITAKCLECTNRVFEIHPSFITRANIKNAYRIFEMPPEFLKYVQNI